MVIRENNKNRTYFLYEQDSGVEVFMSTPFKGAKKAKKLTIRNGSLRFDLNGRQINALRKILSEAENVSA